MNRVFKRRTLFIAFIPANLLMFVRKLQRVLERVLQLSIPVLGLIAATATLRAQPDCLRSPVGIVSLWRAENESVDGIGTNHGQVEKGAGYVPGKVGQAFHFDGVDDHVSVPSSETLQPREALTVEGWVYAEGEPAILAGIAGTWNDVVSNGRTYLLWVSSGNLQFLVYSGGVNDSLYATAQIKLPLDAWVHVAGTYDGSTIRVYQNGELVGSTPFQGTIATNTFPFLIGRTDGAGTPRFWKGSIDELAVYNRALGLEEIREIYSAGGAGKCGETPLALTPSTSTLFGGESVTFKATGGKPPYTFAIATDPPHGTLGATTGVYVAGSTKGLDTVRVTDASGAVATAVITVEQKVDGECTGPLEGMVSWWRAENDAREMLSGKDGILLNGVGFVPGKVGQAFSFDGNGGRVQSDVGSSLSLTTAMTVEGWVRPTAFGKPQGLVLKGVPPFQEADWLFILSETGELVFVVIDASGHAYESKRTAAAAIPLAEWTHVAATFEAVKGGIRIYINGVEATGAASVSMGQVKLIANTAKPLYLGSQLGGAMDEFSIYRRSLTGEELRKIVDAGGAGKCELPPVLQLSPASVTIPPGGTVQFSATGGFPPYLFSIADAQLHGDLDFQTGSYVARNGCGLVQRVRVRDSEGHTAEAVLRIADVEPPSLQCPKDQVELTSSDLGKIVHFEIQAHDNCDVAPRVVCSPPSGSVFPLGTTRVQCTVTDAFGLESTCSFQITVNKDPGAPGVSCEPSANGLLGWWRGESNALDRVGKHHATAVNGAAFALGQYGYAFQFDGVDDYVRVPGSASLNMDRDLTVQFWARPDALGGTQVMICQGGTCGAEDGPSSVVLALDDSGNLSAVFEHQDGSNVSLQPKLPIPNVLQFHHYAYVRSGRSHRLIVDGEPLAEGTFQEAPGSSTGRDLLIGAFDRQGVNGSGPVVQDFFHGRMDEIQIHDRALSLDEIRSGYACRHLESVKVGAVEVVQSVQDMNNSIPLIADKAAIARVHVGRGSETPGGETLFTGKLRGYRNGIELENSPLTPLFPGYATASEDVLSGRRKFEGGTLNFRLPLDWCAEGALSLQLEPDESTPATCDPATHCGALVNFTKAAIPQLKIFQVFAPEAPTLEEIDLALRRMRNMYPVSALDVQLGEVQASREFEGILAKLAGLHASDPDRQRIYYGATTKVDPGFLVAGMADWSTSYRVACGLLDVMEHETGHCLDFDHPYPGDSNFPRRGFCGAQVTLETGPFPFSALIDGQLKATLGPMDPAHPEAMIFGLSFPFSADEDGQFKVVDPYQQFEMMSYCNEGHNIGWASGHNYVELASAIRRVFPLRNEGNQGRPLDISVPSLSGLMRVSGSLKPASNQLRLNPVIPIFNPDSEPVAPGPYAVQLLDGTGRVLDEISFEPAHLIIEAPGETGDVRSFGINLPLLQEARRYLIRSNTTTLATVERSANAPTVSILAPVAGDTLDTSRVTFQWDAQDLDADSLTFTVQYSADGGRTFTTLSTGETNRVLTISRSVLHGSSEARLRVVASDGFNFGQDVSAVFQVANNAPVLFLHSPATNAVVSANDLVTLEASVYDSEDGQPQQAIRWTSDRDGVLGQGPLLMRAARTLSEGTHTIVATAMDAGGLETQRSTVIQVQRYPAPQLKVLGLERSNWVKIGVLAGEGATYVLERSANLKDWAPVQTNRLASQLQWTVDPVSVEEGGRFYRAVLKP